MNETELDYYRFVLKLKEKHSLNNIDLYINDDYEYIKKEEIYISNDAYKGVILFKDNDKYLIDIYVSSGDGTIINGLLSKKMVDYDRALNCFSKMVEYLEENSIIDILKKGKKNFEN